MTINKFQGKTKEEAIEKAKAEFGENAVIMNIKEVKPKGLFGIFASSTYEVTAAIEEKENFSASLSALASHAKPKENISLAADEEIAIPQPMRTPPREEYVKPEPVKARPFPVVSETSITDDEIDERERTYHSEKQFKERLDN